MVKNNQRKQRKLKRDFKEPRPNEWDQDRRKPKESGNGYEEAPTTNADFEAYYKQQAVVPESEWEAFLACLRTPLPTTFRINGSGKFAVELRDKLDKDFFAKLRQQPVEVEGEALDEPRPIAWYPDKLAWQLSYSRTQLRKVKALSDVHELLKRENIAGGISRQEAVSMAPPLFLDIQSHHKILDTCAAPGSKTMQMLELLHAAAGCGGGGSPEGFVVANDLEPARCNLLVHQTRRMNSPALLVTNHDASTFPTGRPEGGPGGQARGLQFDRILCDVPCSGDGTLRKAPDIWRKWNVAMGTGLHPLQVRIALHTASALLKVGGRMVYSTCSFNPVENEAVVAEVLRQGNGTLSLLDVSHELPDFPRSPGLKTWHLKGKGGYYTSYREAEQANLHNSFSPSMFPDAEDCCPLEKCMRVLPHHGDTGGFFIAVLEKLDEMPPLQPDRWMRTKEATQLRYKRHREEARRAKANGSAIDTSTAPSGPSTEEQLRDGGIEPPATRATLSAHPDSEPTTGGQPPPGPAGKNTVENSDDDEAVEGAKESEFGQNMENRADDAAMAAVAFADAVVDGDVREATDAAEDAAEAAEDVADEAQTRRPNGVPAADAEASTGSAEPPAPSPQPSQGNEGPPHGEARTGAARVPEARQPARSAGKKRPVRPGEEPLEFFPASESLDKIVDFFGLGPGLPVREQLVMRIGSGNQVGARKLYFVSKGVKEFLAMVSSKSLKITSAGLKIMERNDKKDPSAGGSPYRLVQDGLGLVLPHVTRQVLRPTASELLRLLKERSVALPAAQRLEGSEVALPPAKRQRVGDAVQSGDEPAAGAKQSDAAEQPGGERAPEAGAPDARGGEIEPAGQARRIPLSDLETLRQLEDIRGGCMVCVLRDDEARQLGLQAAPQPSGVIGAEPIAIVCWHGRANVSIMVDKADAAAMAQKLEAAIVEFAGRHAPG